jgi:hypothetical protein
MSQKDKEFTILRNKRKGENDFRMEYPCDFCNRFAGQVLCVPKTTFFDVDKSRSLRICSTCLHEMQEALAKNIQDNFSIDFLEERSDLFPAIHNGGKK